MKKRIKKKIKKKRERQTYIKRLEEGNRYLQEAMNRLAQAANARAAFWESRSELLELLLYAAVITCGGQVSIQTKGLRERLEGYDITFQTAKAENKIVIEAKEKKAD